MLILTSRQLRDKLPAWLKARMQVLIVGPPGTGKTYTSRKVAVEAFGNEVVEVIDGGNESSWKALFPYKTPSGALELGSALRASGYVLRDGQLVKEHSGGALVVDEANRVPPELKSTFQLLASERIVPWPDGGTVKTDIAIVATGNDSDLGVEEASRAELDRYDLVICLRPKPEEMTKIAASEAGVRHDVAKALVEAVDDLSGKLDPKKVHTPEGLRLIISIGRLLRTGTLGPADAFRGAAERCWPLGRRGAEKYRAEFDATVADVAGRFAGKLATLGGAAAASAPAAAQPTTPGSDPVGQAASLQNLLSSLADATVREVTTAALPLPKGFALTMAVFVTAFGLGCAKHLSERKLKGAAEAERAGVKVRFGSAGQPDTVAFTQVDAHRVKEFCQLALA